MPRGGKRAGAGRKSLVITDDENSYFNKELIGAEFERRWNNLKKYQANARLRARYSGMGIESDLKKFNSIHPSLILKSDGRSIRKIVIEASKQHPDQWPDQFHESVKVSDLILNAASALQNRSKNLDSKSRREERRTPQGFRIRIESKVAAWATSRFGRPISQGYVRDCIEEYRKYRKAN
jgi:hypothetical protein